MTIITPEQSVDDSAEILRGLQDALGALRREIESLTEQAQSGGEIKETAVSGRTSKISSLLTHCLKAQEGVEYEVDAATGVITFAHPPDPDVEIFAGYEFDVPVRFDTDRILVSVESFQAGQVPDVPVIEVRV